ncbi:MAG: T9SS type A sorting domain-containing protein [Bacteroidota bacterium]
MKKYLVILLLFVLGEGYGQNLVPNGSFEDYSVCPTSFGSINLAIPWFQPGNSSDYFNSCANDALNPCGGCGVPNNNLGYQIPRTGKAYAGIGLCEPGWPYGGYREYIEVKLLDTLIENKYYYVEFWISLSRFCMNPVPIGVDAIGAYFSKDSLNYIDSNSDTIIYVFNVIPQIENPEWNIITDTTNWVKISGVFMAKGGEDYMIIGNFKTDENTHTQIAYTNTPGPPVGNAAYYYIDDVSVVEYDSLMPEPSDNSIILYPNPTQDELTIESKGNATPIDFEIFNTMGQLLYKNSMIEKTLVPTAGFAAGIYVIRLQHGERMEFRKLMKN